jgi:excisionase family DNA binding protein
MNQLLDENLNKKYISTKQSAVLLNVSLGTVQKMVESGELLAWKTRGGHRRILVASLQTLLNERQRLFEHLSKTENTLLSFHRNSDDHENLLSILSRFKKPLEMRTSFNYLEGLMLAVELKPNVIFIDSRLPAIEKIILIFFLSQNTQTVKIPVLINKKFMEMPQDSKALTIEGNELLIPYLFKNQEMMLTPDCIFNHPRLIAYEDDYYESHPDLNYTYFEERMATMEPKQN